MKQKKVILSIILIALVVVGVYLANSGIFYKKMMERNLELTQSLPSCDLHTSSCSVKVANNKNIILDIAKPLKSNSDIVFNVTTDLNAKELKMSIFGINMDMVYLQQLLKKSQTTDILER